MKKGMAEGIKQGKEEGIRQGKEEGIKQGKEEGILQVVRTMLKKNVSIDEIMEFTGFSQKKIESLISKI